MKYCIKCHRLLRVADFQKRARSGDRLQAWCKTCFNKVARTRPSRKHAVLATAHGLIGHKVCRLCRLDKPFAEFHRRRKSPDGVQALCKKCQIERVLATIDVQRARRVTQEWTKAHPTPASPKPPKIIVPATERLAKRRAQSRRYVLAHRDRMRQLRALSIFTGDLVEDMEIAKGLIGQYPEINFDLLMMIARAKRQPLSARIAAIYVLGVTGVGRSYNMLERIRRDTKDHPEIRDHAAEALASLQEAYAAANP